MPEVPTDDVLEDKNGQLKMLSAEVMELAQTMSREADELAEDVSENGDEQ